MIKVLYVCGVGPFGGSTKSLFELASELVRLQGVSPKFLAVNGSAVWYYKELSDDMVVVPGLTRFDNTMISHYRGIRWLIILREILHLPYTFYGVFRCVKLWRGKVDCIHANEITEIIPALLLKWLLNIPLVMHVRSVQSTKNNWRTKVLNAFIERYVDKVVAIDRTVAKSLGGNLQVEVVNNSFTANYDETPATDYEMKAVHQDSFKVGYVGSIQVVKGILEFLYIAGIVKSRVGRSVEFFVVGGNAHQDTGVRKFLFSVLGFRQDLSEILPRILRENSIENEVHFLGSQKNVAKFYKRFDVLAAPGYSNAPGRPVFEAAFFEVPSIVCVDEPEDDTLIHGVTGFATKVGDREEFANYIIKMVGDSALRDSMGRAAKALAKKNFSSNANARKFLQIYKSLF